MKRMVRQWVRDGILGAPVRRRPALPPSDWLRILCVVHGGLGDRLMTLPALRALCRLHSGAQVCVAWCGETVSAMATGFHATWQIGKQDAWAQWRLMRGPWDCLFVNSVGIHSLATDAAAAFSRVPLAIGPRLPGQDRTPFNQSFEIINSLHVTALNCRAVGQVTMGPVAYPVETPALPPAAGVAGAPVILHPGCRQAFRGYEENRWPVERYLELAGRLCSKRHEVMALLDPDESADVEVRFAAAGIRTERPASLEALFRIIRAGRVLVGNDSGPVHVAAAVGTPVVALFGPSDPRRSAPVSERASLVCAGYDRVFRYGELGEYVYHPMDRIPVGLVGEAVEPYL